MKHVSALLMAALVILVMAGITFSQRGGGRGSGFNNDPLNIGGLDFGGGIGGGGGNFGGGGRGGGGRGGGWGGGRGGGGERGGGAAIGSDLSVDRRGVPTWEVDQHFKSDVFTFVRIRYRSYGRGGWSIDYPDSDLNFPFRLNQMTSLKVDPVPIILDLTDERIFDYPFLYMLEIGGLVFSDDEVKALRRYLLNGGFLMVDDHWGVAEYENFHEEIKRVFPEREPMELPLEHPIFHCVFDLREKPQIPSIGSRSEVTGPSEPMAAEAIYRGIFDDKGRMMVIICSNTDLGDGWEREGESEYYFKEFSEKKAYPMGINILFYAMTH